MLHASPLRPLHIKTHPQLIVSKSLKEAGSSGRKVDDCGFSLNHPNQFFVESQQILTGGKDIKKESSQPETPQPKHSVQKSRDASSARAFLNSTLEMEMEGIEDCFIT